MIFESVHTPVKVVNRLEFLDGLRGIAILFVMLYHAYVRWPQIVPFGNKFIGFPLFAHGWLGVQLFFLISDFVIFMTLEKCQGFQDFILRRWFRLFPAMFICSIIVYVTIPIFHERPSGSAVIRDLLPGLTFIEPLWWEALLGSHQGVLEGAFWSLFVEVKFYLIAGSLYFLVGGRRMIMALIGLFIAANAMLILVKIFPVYLYPIHSLMEQLSIKYFGWFASGALYYRYFHERHSILLKAAIIVGLASAITDHGLHQWLAKISAIIVVILFTSAILSVRVRAALSHPALLFIGFVSYPLYLLHENMMISMIVKVGHMAPWLPSLLLPIIPMIIVVIVGWLVAEYLEPWLRVRIRFFLKKLGNTFV